jgi:glycosyltransferase involved in cell wall biosynthesis
MKILYIASGFPYPLTSGYLRHYHFIKGLSKHHQITLVSNVSASFKEEDINGISPFTERVIPIPHIFENHPGLINRIKNRLLIQLGANPAIRAMHRAIKKLLAEQSFDLMVLSGAHTLNALTGLQTPPIVADMCDAKSDRIRRQIASTDSFVWKAWSLFKLWEMEGLERRTFRKAASTLFASDRDRNIVPDRNRAHSFVVANGVDTEYWQRKSDSLGKHTLIFTGAMHFPPNSDTAMLLIEKVFPAVRRVIPDARLLIVGHSPGKKLQEAGHQPGITVTGFVDDVRPYLEQATVFVSPMRFGAGIQNKLLEAMSMGLPIITSSVAGDGISVNGAKPPFYVVDDLDAFANCAIELLQRYEAAPTPEYYAREYVETHFTWERNVQRFNEIIQSVR